MVHDGPLMINTQDIDGDVLTFFSIAAPTMITSGFRFSRKAAREIAADLIRVCDQIEQKQAEAE